MQSRILHFDHSGLCEPAADAFVSCRPRRAGSSCHSSRYSARYRSRGIGPEPLPVGTITRGPTSPGVEVCAEALLLEEGIWLIPALNVYTTSHG